MGQEGAGHAVVQLALGVVVGSAVGAAGGWLCAWRGGATWPPRTSRASPCSPWAFSRTPWRSCLDGNGFVAAFCGGLAFGACAGRRGPAELVFLEQTGELVSSLVWLAFGAIAIPIMLDRVDPLMLVYAVLSLTVVRMLPVWLALIGSGLDGRTVLFVGWFGPRGLASLVFALLALEALGPTSDEAVAIVTVTVLVSVLAHGVSAAPLAARYGRAAAAAGPEPGGPVQVVELRPAAAARRRGQSVDSSTPTSDG